jgi:nucleotide-binding universal stress UspA family protein
MSRIVVGVDGTAGSVRALRWALDRASETGASVLVVSAWSYPVFAIAGVEVPMNPFAAQAADAAEHIAAAMYASGAETSGVSVEPDVREGTPDAVLIEASADADLVVVGASHGLGALGAKIAAHSDCPVVIIPEDE